ncbi:IS630 family transposase, partial [Acidimicrobium ferrooxidans]|nr:IS630 family transposase [Acidimicrobium ferrooxidans]
MRIAPAIELSPDERRTLERLARGRRTEVRLVERARMILLAGDGMLNKDIAVELGTTAKRVGLWR